MSSVHTVSWGMSEEETMSAIPNDQRTRQLYIDAAIKRAQAKAKQARLQAAVDADEPGSTVTTPIRFGVPAPREPRT
jgi:hypothetical protein